MIQCRGQHGAPWDVEGSVMEGNLKGEPKPGGRPLKRVLKWGAGVGVLVAIVLGVAAGRGDSEAGYTTFAARRGLMEVEVLEGGSVEALESQELKSQVRGWQGTKILSIVPEGTYVTEEDVKNEMILVELDASEVKGQLVTNQISFRGTEAALSEAEEAMDIQLSKSESEIYSSELELKLARLELEKYLGTKVVKTVLEKVAEFTRKEEDALAKEEPDPIGKNGIPIPGLEKPLGADAGSPSPEAAAVGEGSVNPDEGGVDFHFDVEAIKERYPKVDFRAFAARDELADGAAAQELRRFTDASMLATSELLQAEIDLGGTKKLYARGFANTNELKNAEMDVERKKVSLKSAETQESLFIRYEFPKTAEKTMSDYVLAKRKLHRTEKEARSQIGQANVRRLSARARYSIEAKRIKDMEEQIAKHTMRADRSGLVVYGGSGVRYYDAEPIKEGATVRQKQAIITIPDMSTLAVKVKIHESFIKKVVVGQTASVVIEAEPDKPLTGLVTKVAVLPDSENRYMNPDMKVYKTTIEIDGVHEWLKPGMSAKVEILVERIEETIYIPIQSVVPQRGEQVCFVLKNGKPERRVIETGEMTVAFIEITSGLEEGEEVLIRPPDGSRDDEASGDDFALEEPDEEPAAAESQAQPAASEAP
jgi:RND family efflux transporter MFP subunit